MTGDMTAGAARDKNLNTKELGLLGDTWPVVPPHSQEAAKQIRRGQISKGQGLGDVTGIMKPRDHLTREGLY